MCKLIRRSAILALVTVGLGALLLHPAARADENARIENLKAFTHLYGYVRFFHPSDEASAVDWDKLAIHGAGRVATSKNLSATLEEIFRPLAPTLALYPVDGAPPEPAAWPEDASALELVAWQHRGVGLGSPGPYRSVRTNRTSKVAASRGRFGNLTRSLPAGPFQGRKVRLRAAVKTEVLGGGNQAQLWLRVDRSERQQGFFDNMGNRPITSSAWVEYEILGEVAEDAELLVFGAFLAGQGRMWLDAFEIAMLEDDGTWRGVELANSGFEEEAGEEISGWAAAGHGYDHQVVQDVHHEGKSSLRIGSAPDLTEKVVTIFDAVPKLGETIDEEIGAGLRCRLPLALPSRDGKTLGDPPTETAAVLDRELAALDIAALEHDHTGLRLAAVVITWNVMQHFYPYFDVVNVDWEAELEKALGGVLRAKDGTAFHDTLNRLTAALDDGHAGVHHPAYSPGPAWPALAFQWIDGQVMVIASQVEGIAPGDVVLALDGVATEELYKQREGRSSGTPQWKRHRFVRIFGSGPLGSTMTVRIDRADGEPVNVEVERGLERPILEARPESITKLEGGVYYVDLGRAPMDAISAEIQQLAEAPGVVFDLRGYPRGNHAVIQHLIDEPVQSARWNVAEIIYPDQKKISGWNTNGRWNLEPQTPRIQGRVVFLTDGRAISYAESVLGIVEAYDLAPIVGQATAGANGNVNPLVLPGGFQVTWTGMKVIKHDESQHHMVGIQPTAPLERTRGGVAAGRDELLEKALEIIGGK